MSYNSKGRVTWAEREASGLRELSSWWDITGISRGNVFNSIRDRYWYYDCEHSYGLGRYVNSRGVPLHSFDDAPALTEDCDRRHWIFNGYLHRSLGPAFKQGLTYEGKPCDNKEYFVFGYESNLGFLNRNSEWIQSCERLLLDYLQAIPRFDIRKHVVSFSSWEALASAAVNRSLTIDLGFGPAEFKMNKEGNMVADPLVRESTNRDHLDKSKKSELKGVGGALAGAAAISLASAFLKKRKQINKQEKEFKQFCEEHREQIEEYQRANSK